MKFFYSFMLICFILGTIWTISAKGADGSWIGMALPAALGGGTAIYKQRVTGSWLSDSSGGR